MTKVLIGLMVMFSAGAPAQQLTRLFPPAPIVARAYSTCIGSSFNADSSVAGVCRTAYAYPCSGRGCQPLRVTSLYVASWDVFGTPVSAILCSVTKRHLPQPPIVTYYNGYTSCPAMNFNPTGTVVVIYGVPYFYVATDPLTGAELVNSNVVGYLVLPSVASPDYGKFE